MKKIVKKSEYITQNEDGTIDVDIPVSYEVCGTTNYRFDSLADMEKKLDSLTFSDHLKLPKDPIYIDGSFEVNHDVLEWDIEKHKLKD